MTGLLTGIQLFFVVLFGFTSVVKLAGLTRFELTLVQLFGTRPFVRFRLSSRVAAVAIALYELGLAVLTAFTGTVVLLGTTVVFTAVVWRAWRLHVGCGCFPDRRPAEVSAIVRSVTLVLLAAALLAFGTPPVAGLGHLLLGVLWAVGIAGVVYLSYTVTGLLVRRRDGTGAEAPRVVPAAIAAQILEQHGRPALPAVLTGSGWVEVVPLCRATGLAVSTLFGELERRSTVATAPMLPVGSRPDRPAMTSISGAEITPDRLAAPTVVVLFSATCTRCPGHVPEVVEFLRGQRLDPRRVLVLVSGDGPGARKFVDALGELATVVVEPELGPVAESFGTREFPAFYLMDSAWTVLAAARTVGELRLVAA